MAIMAHLCLIPALYPGILSALVTLDAEYLSSSTSCIMSAVAMYLKRRPTLVRHDLFKTALQGLVGSY